MTVVLCVVDAYCPNEIPEIPLASPYLWDFGMYNNISEGNYSLYTGLTYFCEDGYLLVNSTANYAIPIWNMTRCVEMRDPNGTVSNVNWTIPQAKCIRKRDTSV